MSIFIYLILFFYIRPIDSTQAIIEVYSKLGLSRYFEDNFRFRSLFVISKLVCYLVTWPHHICARSCFMPCKQCFLGLNQGHV